MYGGYVVLVCCSGCGLVVVIYGGVGGVVVDVWIGDIVIG